MNSKKKKKGNRLAWKGSWFFHVLHQAAFSGSLTFRACCIIMTFSILNCGRIIEAVNCQKKF